MPTTIIHKGGSYAIGVDKTTQERYTMRIEEIPKHSPWEYNILKLAEKRG